jgi:hypothetical protein
MPPNNQQSSPQPDYSFITNQPVPDNGGGKKMNVRFVVLISLVVVLVLTAIVGAFLSSARSKVKEVSRADTPALAAEGYFKSLSEYKVQDAYEFLAKETREKDTLDTFTKGTANVFVNTIDLKSCKSVQSNTEENGITTVECPSLQDKNLTIVFELETLREGSDFKISKYTIDTKGAST